MFDLVSVDGVPVAQMREDGGELIRPVDPFREELRAIRDGQAQLMSVLLAQQSELAKLSAALSTVRISRTQEIAMNSAIKARAAMLARTEQLEGCERRIAGAIRTTIRETTGARAIGDLQAGQYDRAMDMVNTWHMSGALRRIRREAER